MSGIIIIAEAGVNHNGSLDIAKRLVDTAKTAGADFVKFQSFKADRIASRNAQKAEYQKVTTESKEGQYEMLKRLELDRAAHIELMAHCRQAGIKFLSTAFDIESVELLSELGVGLWKIPSGEITNLPYLRAIGKKRQEVILSTGMADMDEIGSALRVLESAGTARAQITLLHCTTEYPAPIAEINLRAMGSLARVFGTKAGYSDHSPGMAVSLAAAALGASVIEKHFTLDRKMAGPDHAASLEPEELAAMVRGIRQIEEALGDGIKKPTYSEIKNRPIARKSIVAATKIAEGETFSEDNLTTKRPGTGLSPMAWDKVVGSRAKRSFEIDEEIEL